MLGRLTKNRVCGILLNGERIKMKREQIFTRVAQLKTQLANGNSYGEKVTLVVATKTQSVEAINWAIEAGVDAVAENKPQEFRDKNEFMLPCPRHFIGHLQTNKIKYLIGKIELYHSLDRDELADELARQSVKRGIYSNVLVQINIGEEESKGGYAYQTARETFLRLRDTDGLKVKGFMAMLPESKDEALLRELVKKMRSLFDWAKTQSDDVEYLSMGMSGDYTLCVEEGSNMIRVGSTVFGARDYN
ncbi:MAG: YggS family pyridoxal phosphate-dependent enzyme [Clostridiales bacterium]|nr:YggS family pyridoxal phosphate-dependent enzyme [Clostridiales bacterium]